MALAVLRPVFLQRSRHDPSLRASEHFSDKPNRANVVNVVSTDSREWQREAFSGRKNLGKSWKQILVEHWTSHYFSLCLQMLLATVSSAKGRNKGACHRTTNSVLPPDPSPLLPQRSPPPPFFSSLLLSLRCTTFITNHHPATTRHLLPARSSISRSPFPSLPSSSPTRLLSLRSPFPLSLRHSLSLSLSFFLALALSFFMLES